MRQDVDDDEPTDGCLFAYNKWGPTNTQQIKYYMGVKYYMGSGLVSCMQLVATTGHLLQLLGVSSPFLDLGTTATL